MGYSLSKISNFWDEKTPYRILMLGLDNSGKTTILQYIRSKENLPIISTVETVSTRKGLTFTAWDVDAHQVKLRPLWNYYFQNTDGLLYVVDCADIDRINESYEALHFVLEDPVMHDKPIVILANKQDLPSVLSCSELVDKLDLKKLSETRNKWHVQSCSGISGIGIYESIEKISDMIKNQQKSENPV